MNATNQRFIWALMNLESQITESWGYDSIWMDVVPFPQAISDYEPNFCTAERTQQHILITSVHFLLYCM